VTIRQTKTFLGVVLATCPLLLAGSLTASPKATFAASAVADGYVRADRPHRTFGHARRLVLGSRPTARAYVRFLLRPTSQRVARTTLSVWAHKSSRARFTVRIGANRWSERSLTFGRAARPARATIASGRVRRGWNHVNVTSFVQRGGPSITFILSSSSRTPLSLASREHRSKGPRLRVTLRPPAGTVVLAGAGDIAYAGSEDFQTSALLDAIDPDVVFTLGDNAYENGTPEKFAAWYHPTWGRYRAKTRPAAGNHEYRTPGAAGYFGYFGARAGDPATGYYSYDVGSWHVVVLNTNGEGPCARIPCHGGSAQERWLRADLEASKKLCTLAYWHHPRFSVGPEGNAGGTEALWDALYEKGAELVLAASSHNYQRWKPMNADGQVDSGHGIRSFVVGTGGKTPHPLGSHPNVEAANTGTPGVLKLTLRPGAYDWQFVPVTGRTFTDAGSARCH
jgi:acid phosphatase type 7